MIDERPVPVLLVDTLGSEGATARRVLPRAIPGDVHRDPEEPGVERGVAPERRERLEGSDEGVLRHVPRLVGVAQDVVGEPVHPLAILLDQRLEGRQVAGAAPLDQGRIVAVHLDSLARPLPRRRLDVEEAAVIHRREAGRRESDASASKPST